MSEGKANRIRATSIRSRLPRDSNKEWCAADASGHMYMPDSNTMMLRDPPSNSFRAERAPGRRAHSITARFYRMAVRREAPCEWCGHRHATGRLLVDTIGELVRPASKPSWAATILHWRRYGDALVALPGGAVTAIRSSWSHNIQLRNGTVNLAEEE